MTTNEGQMKTGKLGSTWLVVICLMIVGMAWRVMSTAQLIIKPVVQSTSADPALQATIAREQAMIMQVVRQDSLLAALNESLPVSRDPFHRPRVRLPRTTTVVGPPPVPVATFLVVDSAKPLAILAVPDSSSPLLGIGDTWNGWTIRGITERGVTVCGFDQTIELLMSSR